MAITHQVLQQILTGVLSVIICNICGYVVVCVWFTETMSFDAELDS